MVRQASLAALDGRAVGWFAPTYKLSQEAMEECARRLRPVASVRQSERRILLPTGGRIEYWTLEDPDAGRSRAYDLAIVDEAGLKPDVDDVWHHAIRPTLADRRGSAWFCGTPKGRNGFWRLHRRAGDDSDWASVSMPTASNPWIPADEIEAARAGMPERAFRQEFLAEFLEDGGGVFANVRERVRRAPAPEPQPPVWIGVDLARLEDHTVCSAVDSLGRQIAMARWNKADWSVQAERIAQFAARFHGSTLLVDSTGVGDPVLEMLRGRGLRCEGFRFTAESKRRLVDNLATLMDRGELELLDDPVQTAELEAYEYQPLPGGGYRTSAPAGMHDDTVMALALACWRLGTKPREWSIV